jgi:hypothetical protein
MKMQRRIARIVLLVVLTTSLLIASGCGADNIELIARVGSIHPEVPHIDGVGRDGDKFSLFNTGERNKTLSALEAAGK